MWDRKFQWKRILQDFFPCLWSASVELTLMSWKSKTIRVPGKVQEVLRLSDTEQTVFGGISRATKLWNDELCPKQVPSIAYFRNRISILLCRDGGSTVCWFFFRKGQITVFAKQTKSKKERSKERVNSKTVLFLVPLFCRLKTAEHLFVGWFSYSYTQKGS